MKVSNFKKIVWFVVKYIVPVVVGWLEGDSHSVQTLLGI